MTTQKIQTTIYFDMDGTIADLYGYNNWLEELRAANPAPYKGAVPLQQLQPLARRLNKLQAKGYKLGIISWLSKTSTPKYDEEVTKAKLWWLKKHLHSVKWDEIFIVKYGTPKENYCFSENDILFDDEERNRKNWTGKAYDESQIMEVLKAVA